MYTLFKPVEYIMCANVLFNAVCGDCVQLNCHKSGDYAVLINTVAFTQHNLKKRNLTDDFWLTVDNDYLFTNYITITLSGYTNK